MVLLYWDIGQMILARQASAGWGAKVIDRLAADLRQEFPDMHGFSPRNLKYMRAFTAAWPDRAIVQRVVAQLPWRQNLALLERLGDPDARLWYAKETFVMDGLSPSSACRSTPGLTLARSCLASYSGRRSLVGASRELRRRREEKMKRLLRMQRELQAEAAKPDTAIAANLKELAYGG